MKQPKKPSREFLETLKVGDSVLYWELQGGYLHRMNKVAVHSICEKIVLTHFGIVFEIPLEGFTESTWISEV